jgi:hypothetical protein
MQTEETAVVFQDGAVAVARLKPFRVDWRLPDGHLGARGLHQHSPGCDR